MVIGLLMEHGAASWFYGLMGLVSGMRVIQKAESRTGMILSTQNCFNWEAELPGF